MIAVDAVFGVQLPIAPHQIGLAAAHHFQAFRRLIRQMIDERQRFSKMRFQRLHVFVEAPEDEPLVIRHARHRRQAFAGAFRTIKPAIFLFLYMGAAAGRVEAPAVEPAGDGLHVAASARCQDRAAMRAGIDEGAQLAVFLADHEDRLPPDIGRVVIAEIPHLAFMAEIDPDPAEDAIHFGLENFRSRINTSVNAKHAVFEPVFNEWY